MAIRLTFTGEQWWDAVDRNAYAGAKIYTFDAGTTNPKTTWNSADESTQNANPVVADANGIFPEIYGDGSYFVEVFDTDDTELIYQEDNIASDPSASDDDTNEVNNLDLAKTTDLSDFDLIFVQSLTPGWEDTPTGPVDGFYAHSDGTTGTPNTGDENQFFDAAGNGWTRDDNQRIDEQEITDLDDSITALENTYSGYIFGINTRASDGDTVDVTAGKCADSTGVLVMDVTAQSIDIKNRIDAEGNLSGSDAPTADSTYFIFVVSEADGSNVRLAFDLSANATNALSEWSAETGETYTLYRLIGFAPVNATSDIFNFFHTDNQWSFSGAQVDRMTNFTSTNQQQVSMPDFYPQSFAGIFADFSITFEANTNDAHNILVGLSNEALTPSSTFFNIRLDVNSRSESLSLTPLMVVFPNDPFGIFSFATDSDESLDITIYYRGWIFNR